MSYELSAEEVSHLFHMRKPEEVTRFLGQLQTNAGSEWRWRPLGDRVNNAGNVEVLAEPGPALVERITNAIDAMLELRHQELGAPEPGPPTPKKAAEEWFGIKGGTLDREKDEQIINLLSPKIRVDVFDSGNPKRPTVTITDCGIGQHPSDLPHTILSLGASNKIGRQYLCGAYGQGGSATFAWCEYTIIVSRRRPEHCNGRPDQVGWTIVRRYDDADLKLYTYQYLVTETNEIPVVSPSCLSNVDFEFGTYIAHISYKLDKLAPYWSLVGYRYLNHLLFDPVLPYTIRDHREPQPQDRYMYGSRGRLAAAQVEYSNEYVANLGADGSLTIRYWVFYERRGTDERAEGDAGVTVDSYLEFPKSSRIVVVTLNGQRHAYLEKAFIKNVTRYSLLSDSLLVQVECDYLSRQRKKDLFLATRSGIAAGEERLELIEKWVKEALKDDKALERLDQERVQRHLSTIDAESERKVKRLLDQLISISRTALGPGASERGADGQVRSGEERYRAKDPPTYFRFAEEQEPLCIQAGEGRVIDIITDGPDDMFTRRNRRASLTLEVIGEQIVTMRYGLLHSGRMSVTVTSASNARIGATCQLRAVLEMNGGVYFATHRPCQIVSPRPPYLGQEPPTKLAIVARGNLVRLKRGATTRVAIETDARDDLLSRKNDPAHLELNCAIPDILTVARRGPRRGLIEVFLDTPSHVLSNGKSPHGSITARLHLADGTVLEDTKPCTIVEPPPEGVETGTKKRREANYKIIEVWRAAAPERPNAITWDRWGWNETYVGKYEITHDQEGNDLLLLYINMDNEDLRHERERRLRSSGESAANRLDIRYKAYIGYHLWLCSQQKPQSTISKGQETLSEEPAQLTAQEDNMTPSAQDEEILQNEMRRVAKTIILAMRSEHDLFTGEDTA